MLNNEIFIKRSKDKFGDKFDYSLLDYKGVLYPVTLICKVHGVFEINANIHLNSPHGCLICSKLSSVTTGERPPRDTGFVEKSRVVHGDKYDYSIVKYEKCNRKVKIICPIHGIFEQTPTRHLEGSGCVKCGIDRYRGNIENFIERSSKIHQSKYNYSLSVYRNIDTKIDIICPEHGIFQQIPRNHLKGHGCKKCNIESVTKDLEIFIEDSRKVHGDKFDYSLSVYTNSMTKLKIICPVHGVFEQSPNTHFKSGCKKCADDLHRTTYEDFVSTAKSVHGNKYDYLSTVYVNMKTKVNILCKKHGTFIQNPFDHLNGMGCPICSESKGERKIRHHLDEKKIKYIFQKKFDGCRNERLLSFDFFLPDINLCIEYDGKQHYEPIDFFGGPENLKTVQKRDFVKERYCSLNNIQLIRIRYDQDVEAELSKFL